MIEIRMIGKNQLWDMLEQGPINFILFGGSRLTYVDEVLAAYERDTFVGAVTLSSRGELYEGPSIIGLLVLKAWRRQGIGTKLLKSAINRMKERELTPAYIDVLSKNAKNLIEKLDDDFRKCLFINDQSKYDCFDRLEQAN